MPLSRRQLLRLAPAGLAFMGAGRLARAAASAGGRKLLFVYVKGGWDPTWGLAPMFDSPYVDTDDASTEAEAGGINFVDAAERPSVRSFFETWGAQTCLLHGMEVRAVTHEQCRRLIMTGTNSNRSDDWPSRVAGASPDFFLPSLVISGPSYTTNYTSSVVRVGYTGQLSRLLDGTALDESDQLVIPPGASTSALIEAHVRARAAAHAAAADPRGQAGRFAADLEASLDRLALVEAKGDDFDLNVAEAEDAYLPVSDRAAPALYCLEKGISRVAVIEHSGLLGMNWDTHSQNYMQSAHYEILFQDLLAIMAELQTRIGTSGAPLSEEVAMVVVSEMGRAPQLNAMQGKDHWTYTSAMFVGAGIRGGQVLGGYDESLLGKRVDLQSGAPSESGELLTSNHLGATVLALCDVDSEDVPPIEGILA